MGWLLKRGGCVGLKHGHAVDRYNTCPPYDKTFLPCLPACQPEGLGSCAVAGGRGISPRWLSCRAPWLPTLPCWAREQAHADALVGIKQGCWLLAAGCWLFRGWRRAGWRAGGPLVRGRWFEPDVRISGASIILEAVAKQASDGEQQRVTGVKDMGKPKCLSLKGLSRNDQIAHPAILPFDSLHATAQYRVQTDHGLQPMCMARWSCEQTPIAVLLPGGREACQGLPGCLAASPSCVCAESGASVLHPAKTFRA